MHLSVLIFVCVQFVFAHEFDKYETMNFNKSKGQELQNCACVPYWQCKDDYSGLIEEGVDIVDVRVLRGRSDLAPPCTGDFDVCCKIECGKRRGIPEMESRVLDDEVIGFRILGADNEAEFGEFPWMLGVLHGKTYRCGASLIHPNVAMTAAHCVDENKTYKVRAGEWNWVSNKEPLPHQDRMTKKIIIHPQYHPGSLSNDIALLVVDTSFRISENVGVACLPPKFLVMDYKRCVVTGWGKNSHETGTYQSTLKKMDLPIVPNRSCMKSLQVARLGPTFRLHDSFLCAGGEDRKDACKGDGGSPLICPVEGHPGRYEQVGIVSWGLTCGLADTPGVYVNVALFSDWIDYELESQGFDINVYRY